MQSAWNTEIDSYVGLRLFPLQVTEAGTETDAGSQGRGGIHMTRARQGGQARYGEIQELRPELCTLRLPCHFPTPVGSASPGSQTSPLNPDLYMQLLPLMSKTISHATESCGTLTLLPPKPALPPAYSPGSAATSTQLLRP